MVLPDLFYINSFFSFYAVRMFAMRMYAVRTYCMPYPHMVPMYAIPTYALFYTLDQCCGSPYVCTVLYWMYCTCTVFTYATGMHAVVT
jgi:hypothetical protein